MQGTASHIGDLRPTPAGGEDAFDELSLDADDQVIDSGERPAGGTTGVHRRASLPPPIPKEALSQRPPRASTTPPGAAGGTGVHRVPPPPPPPMPANFAALRSQLQRVNSRCHELLCERARLEKQLVARDRALDAMRLEQADLERSRHDRDGGQDEVEFLRRELAALRARVAEDQAEAPVGDRQAAPGLTEEELQGLRADRIALRALREHTAGFEAMRIELQRLRETSADVERLRAEHTELVSLRRVRDDNGRLRGRLAELEAERKALQAELEAERKALQAELEAERNERKAELEAERKALQAELEAERNERKAELEALRSKLVAVGPTLADIKGIGPTFARRLESMSIDVSAVAAWDESELQRIADVIKTQPARIRRQRWIEQARELVNGHPPGA